MKSETDVRVDSPHGSILYCDSIGKQINSYSKSWHTVHEISQHASSLADARMRLKLSSMSVLLFACPDLPEVELFANIVRTWFRRERAILPQVPCPLECIHQHDQIGLVG